MTNSPSDQVKPIRVRVSHPERFWFAIKDDLAWLTTDPDVEDQKQRHADRDTIRWDAVGHVVQEFGTHLMNQDYAPVGDEEPTVFELFLPDSFSLTPAEREIVTAWFWGAERVRNDPWDDSAQNGRHRLWNVWKASPDMILPIYSELLLYEDDIPHMDEEFAQSILLSSKVGTLKVAADAPVRARSTAYFAQLESNAAKLPNTQENDLDIHLLTYIETDKESSTPTERKPSVGTTLHKDQPQKKRSSWFRRLFR